MGANSDTQASLGFQQMATRNLLNLAHPKLQCLLYVPPSPHYPLTLCSGHLLLSVIMLLYLLLSHLCLVFFKEVIPRNPHTERKPRLALREGDHGCIDIRLMGRTETVR